MAELFVLQGDLSAAIAQARAACRHDEQSAFLRLRLAELLLSEGDIEGAEESAERACELASVPPRDDEALVRALQIRATTRSQLGDHEGALALLRQALVSMPADASVRTQLARALVQAGDLDAAEELLTSSFTLGPDAHEAALALARVLAEHGEVDRALTHLDRALAVRRGDVELLQHKRDLLWATGRHVEALRVAHELARVDDDDDVRFGLLVASALVSPSDARTFAAAWLHEADDALTRLRIADALETAGLVSDAAQVLSVDGGSQALFVHRARLLLSEHKVREAKELACHQRARLVSGRSLPSTRGLAGQPRVSASAGDDDVFANDEQQSLAIAVCARARADDGEADEAMLVLQDGLARLGPRPSLVTSLAVVAPRASPARVRAVREAIMALCCAARQASNDDDETAGINATSAASASDAAPAWTTAETAETTTAKAAALQALGAAHEAHTLLEKRLRQAPNDPVLTRAWAELLAEQATSAAQVDAAVELAERWLERHGDDVDVLNFVAFSWLEGSARYEDASFGPSPRRACDAAKRAWRALLRAPLSGAVVDTLGWAELGCGDLERARELLQRATQLLPDDGEVWFHRAMAEVLAARQRPLDAQSRHGAAWAAARARSLLRVVASPHHERLLRRLDAAEPPEPTDDGLGNAMGNSARTSLPLAPKPRDVRAQISPLPSPPPATTTSPTSSTTHEQKPTPLPSHHDRLSAPGDKGRSNR
jgi:tetratricopeptide (TPR) repeat protein